MYHWGIKWNTNSWNKTGTNARPAGEAGIVRFAREPATVVNAKSAQERGGVRTAREPATNWTSRLAENPVIESALFCRGRQCPISSAKPRQNARPKIPSASSPPKSANASKLLRKRRRAGAQFDEPRVADQKTGVGPEHFYFDLWTGKSREMSSVVIIEE